MTKKSAVCVASAETSAPSVTVFRDRRTVRLSQAALDSYRSSSRDVEWADLKCVIIRTKNASAKNVSFRFFVSSLGYIECDRFRVVRKLISYVIVLLTFLMECFYYITFRNLFIKNLIIHRSINTYIIDRNKRRTISYKTGHYLFLHARAETKPYNEAIPGTSYKVLKQFLRIYTPLSVRAY